MNIDMKKLIKHYEQIERLQNAGGLRKELNPEICIQIHIQFHYPEINIMKRMLIANDIKQIVQHKQSIPW
jgi:hypothetical protein